MTSKLQQRLGRVGVWMNVGADVPVDELRATGRAVEELGYGALWFAETPRTREALVQAALLLAATEQLQVATGITSVYSRDAIALRAGAAALEEAFPGRFVCGIGVSHAPAVQARGHSYGRPLATMRAYLDALGDPGVPLVLAALQPKMLGLARDRSAGAHPYFAPVAHTERARELLGDGPLLAPEVTVDLDGDVARARSFMDRYLRLPNYRRNLLGLGYEERELDPDGPSDRLVADIVGLGDAAAGRVRAHLDAGADHVCVQALGTPSAAVAQLRALAPQVLAG